MNRKSKETIISKDSLGLKTSEDARHDGKRGFIDGNHGGGISTSRRLDVSFYPTGWVAVL